DRYRPSVLWNDISYPQNANIKDLFAYYYNQVPDGVVNDRFTLPAGGDHRDFDTPEYSARTDITPQKWEEARGFGLAFGYNAQESAANMLSVDQVVDLVTGRRGEREDRGRTDSFVRKRSLTSR